MKQSISLSIKKQNIISTKNVSHETFHKRKKIIAKIIVAITLVKIVVEIIAAEIIIETIVKIIVYIILTTKETVETKILRKQQQKKIRLKI